MTRELVLGTRGSRLALWQSDWVAGRLVGHGTPTRQEIIRTQGDRDLDLDLSSSLDKGLFTKEIEDALLAGRIDLAVHSLKDLPTEQPASLVVAAVPSRGPAGDVLLVRPDALDESAPLLPVREGARVGTASPRRLAMLSAARPDCASPSSFRGNVPTRVAKCVRGEADAVILARAGVERLGLDVLPLLAFDLDPSRWLHAPGQGALAIETREADEEAREAVQVVHDPFTAESVAFERSLLAKLEAGCHAALGAWARREDGVLRFTAGALGSDGRWRTFEAHGLPLEGAVEQAFRALAVGAPVSPPDARPLATPSRPWATS